MNGTPRVANPTLAQRWACVIDPVLAFAPEGPLAVRDLSRVLEVWVFRELWHILDNTLFYARGGGEAVFCALDQWERLRHEHALNDIGLFWVGDGLSESFLPEHQSRCVVERFERLARALERRTDGARADTPLEVAMRDAVALTCALDRAFLLTALPERVGAALALDEALRRWGLVSHEGDVAHPLLVLERDVLRRVAAEAGLARLCLTGVRLVVMHIVAPYAPYRTSIPITDESTADSFADPSGSFADPWRGARAVWYPLY